MSSFSVLFGAANANSAEGMATVIANVQAANPAFGPLNAYCLMLFCLLYVPCVAAVATIKKESGSVKFTVGLMAFQIILAWIAAVLVFQIGSLFP